MNGPKDILLADVAIGLFVGLVATKATGFAAAALAHLVPDGAKDREARLRPEPTSRVAARQAAEGLHFQLDKRRLGLATTAVHYGVGAAWGPVYGILRRHGQMRPGPAALATGAAMSLILDVMLVPALRLSPPNRAFPAVTHVRGFLNHLAYGAAAALTAEAIYRLIGTTPGPRRGGPRP